MQQEFESEEDAITGINVTPLVDITLVLLIIFMVTARLISEPSFGVNLPKSTTQQKATVTEKDVFLTIDEQDQIFLNGERVSKDQIGPKIREMMKTKPDMNVILRADRRVSHGDVMEVLDRVRAEGVTQFGIAVEGAK